MRYARTASSLAGRLPKAAQWHLPGRELANPGAHLPGGPTRSLGPGSQDSNCTRDGGATLASARPRSTNGGQEPSAHQCLPSIPCVRRLAHDFVSGLIHSGQARRQNKQGGRWPVSSESAGGDAAAGSRSRAEKGLCQGRGKGPKGRLVEEAQGPRLSGQQQGPFRSARLGREPVMASMPSLARGGCCH